MAPVKLNKKVIAQIDSAVECYKEKIQDYVNLTSRVVDHFTNHKKFMDLIHSSKFRTKDPKHLRGKLIRKAKEAKKNNKKFDITDKNIFEKINDFAGVRFLHIHTKQIKSIHPLMLEIFEKYGYKQVEDPIAYTWDIENQKVFKDAGFVTSLRKSMYTSVHYTVEPHYSSDRCEIQVRTLMEELWGEVSHTINYPYETGSVACREQLLALARIASGCTRLVDSIFTSFEDYKTTQQK